MWSTIKLFTLSKVNESNGTTPLDGEAQLT